VATDLEGVHAVGVRLSEAGLAFERVDVIACEAPVVLDSYPEAKVCLGAAGPQRPPCSQVVTIAGLRYPHRADHG
jgi:hypothetical protein